MATTPAPDAVSPPDEAQSKAEGRSSGAGRKRRAPATSVESIYERILAAVMEHRLPPGTKLIEERLGAAFRVSRTKIRQVLGRLAHDGVVTVYPNRGTFVSSPTVEEARHVLDARRLIEPALIRQIATSATPRQIARLREHVSLESRARAANDRRTIIRLSGEFHILIADMAGNPYLAKPLRELASLTCLIIALYDSPTVPACLHNEHDDIVDAVAAKDAERAATLMVSHLGHVERALDMHVPASEEIDLEAVFAA
jgi:DNA-binding GntR family transcriptional regulator